MKDRLDLYLELYKEYRLEIRHQEIQRSTVSTICVAFAGALIGLSFQDKMTHNMWPYLGLLLINFSLAATFMLRKLYERFELGRERSQLYLKKIDECLLSNESRSGLQSKAGPLQQIWKEGRRWGERQHPFFSFVRLYKLWGALLAGSAMVGFFLIKASGIEGQSVPSQLGLGPRWTVWHVAIAGPILQFAFLYWFQVVEKSKYKDAKRWDEKLLWIVWRWHRVKRQENQRVGKG